MTETPDVPPAPTPPKGPAALLLSRELLWPYLVFVGFLLLLGVVLSALGGYYLVSWWRGQGYEGNEYLRSGIVYLAAGMLAVIVAMGVRQARRYYHRIYEYTLDRIKSLEFKKIDPERFDLYQQMREEEAQRDFENNLRSTLVLERLEVRELLLFPEADWSLQPGVNVLLGRNGYGKSLLLRTLAGVLQRDEEVLKQLLVGRAQFSATSAEVWLRRNAEKVRIRRNALRFEEPQAALASPPADVPLLAGKIPLLAIPDSRFIDRSQDAVGPEDSETSDLRNFGAHHFLHLKPFATVVRSLIYEICLDYSDHGRSFDLPVFAFLTECVKRLTGYDFRFYSIERKGRIGFEVLVLTEGNKEPLPIQHASQGTLSVLAMFGLIRSYVRSLSSKPDDEVVQKGSGIVLIDEADAHLHPAWQQKFPSLLKYLFPNVQFILSAHSPLFVAGCWRGEVAVLRRRQLESATSSFFVEQLDQDFVGATAKELYQKIFEVEELDDTYLDYATKATRRPDDRRLNELTERSDKGRLSQQEDEELRNLEQEERRMSRAVEVQQQRREESNKDARIDELESRILRLKKQVAAKAEGSAP